VQAAGAPKSSSSCQPHRLMASQIRPGSFQRADTNVIVSLNTGILGSVDASDIAALLPTRTSPHRRVGLGPAVGSMKPLVWYFGDESVRRTSHLQCAVEVQTRLEQIVAPATITVELLWV